MCLQRLGAEGPAEELAVAGGDLASAVAAGKSEGNDMGEARGGSGAVMYPAEEAA